MTGIKSLLALITGLLLLLPAGLAAQVPDSLILSFVADPDDEGISFYWQDSTGRNYSNFGLLRAALQAEGRELVFAMNGGMFKRDASPQGLYVEAGNLMHPLDEKEGGYGNFYMQPNGVFYLSREGKGYVVPTSDFVLDSTVWYATQSGPMLLIEGKRHKKFTNGSTNLNIRNGVGILPDGRLLFAMSKEPVNFFDFAGYFLSKGCKNALYLDGAVSRTYLPAQNWEQIDGIFGVIIGLSRELK